MSRKVDTPKTKRSRTGSNQRRAADEFRHADRQFVSLRRLAVQWQCHQNTVERALDNAGIRPDFIGGIKRYPKDEMYTAESGLSTARSARRARIG